MAVTSTMNRPTGLQTFNLEKFWQYDTAKHDGYTVKKHFSTKNVKKTYYSKRP